MQIDKLDDTSRILIVSQSHTAVDNIIEGLIEMNSGQWNIIRIGRTENISAKVEEKCTIGAIRKNLFTDIKEKSNAYIEQKNLMYKDILDKKMVERWSRIKDIQADWINRCSNLETLDYQVIKSATIIAGTCVGFLSNDFVKDLDFDYVIIDEAPRWSSDGSKVRSFQPAAPLSVIFFPSYSSLQRFLIYATIINTGFFFVNTSF